MVGGLWWVAERVGSERLKVGSVSGVSGAVVAAAGKVCCLRRPLRARFRDLAMVWVVLGGEELLC